MVNVRRYFKTDLDFFCWINYLNKEKVLKHIREEEENKNKPPISFESVLAELEAERRHQNEPLT